MYEDSEIFPFSSENMHLLNSLAAFNRSYSQYQLYQQNFKLEKPYTSIVHENYSSSSDSVHFQIGNEPNIVLEDKNEKNEGEEVLSKPRKKRKKTSNQSKPTNTASTEERHLITKNDLIIALDQIKKYIHSITSQDKQITAHNKDDRVRIKDIPTSDPEDHDQNETHKPPILVDLVAWGSMITDMQQKFGNIENDMISLEDYSIDELEDSMFYNRLIANNSERVIKLFDSKFLIPSNSIFLMSDLNNMNSLMTAPHNGNYDLVVVDPPWENKSAQRGNKYKTLPNYTLFQLPVHDLIHSTTSSKLEEDVTGVRYGYVAVWVTNKDKYYRFVIDQLFPKWKVEYVTTWYWVKITDEGELITPIDSTHRRPYEPLVIGKYLFSSRSTTLDKEETKIVEEKTKFFFSVPSFHSQKPPLEALFKPYFQSQVDYHCLELFARNLAPNWTSWGNEVLHFQQLDYFQQRKL